VRAMSYSRFLATALALSLTCSSVSAVPRCVQGDTEPDPLAAALEEQFPITPDVAELVSDLLEAARGKRSSRFRKCFDRDGVLDRAEQNLDSDLGVFERMALRRESLTPKLEELEAGLRTALERAPVDARMQRELPSGLRSVVLRLQTEVEPSEYYLFLLVNSEDDGTRIVDFEFEDSGSWLSEQIALVMWAGRESERVVDELNTYSTQLATASSSFDEGYYETAFTDLLEAQPLAAQLPPPIPAVYERLLMEYAFNAGELGSMRDAANRLLALRPDHALAYYFLALAAEEDQQITEVRKYAGLYQAQVGLDASSLTMTGNSYLRQGRLEEALQRWRSALDQNPANFAALLALGEHLPSGELDELVARLRAVPDLGSVLEGLLDAWKNVGRCAAIRVASALRLETHPNDANGYYFVALCELHVGDWAAALEAGLAGRELAPLKELEAYDNVVVRAVLAAEGSVAAYAAAQLESKAFDYLGERLVYDPADADELLELVAARKQDDPQDIWLHYYRGKALAWKDDHVGAKREYELGAELAADLNHEDGVSAYRYNVVRACYDLGQGAAIYTERPQEEVYGWVLDWMLEDRDGVALEALLDVRSRLQPDDPFADFWRAHALLISGRAERAMEMLLAGREHWAHDETVRYWLEEDLVVAAIASGRLEEALAFAKESTERDGDPLYELYVYVASGDVGNALVTFDYLIDLGYESSEMYAHRQVGQALRESADMQAFRLRWPITESEAGDGTGASEDPEAPEVPEEAEEPEESR
jgi:tetratricopeptide (TPR) repeat protein